MSRQVDVEKVASVADVIAKLDEDTRDAILAAEEDSKLCFFFVRFGREVAATLREIRRLELGFDLRSGIVLNELGLAVRDYLLKEQGSARLSEGGE